MKLTPYRHALYTYIKAFRTYPLTTKHRIRIPIYLHPTILIFANILKIKATHDPVCFFAFVSLPQLVAGPIERATNLLPQFEQKRTFDLGKATDGMRQVLWGFFNYKYLNKIIDLVDEHRIKMYFIYMPVLFASDFYDQEYYYNAYEQNFSQIELLDYNALDVPDSYRADEHHLNKEGAVFFTKKLRTDIATPVEVRP